MKRLSIFVGRDFIIFSGEYGDVIFRTDAAYVSLSNGNEFQFPREKLYDALIYIGALEA